MTHFKECAITEGVIYILGEAVVIRGTWYETNHYIIRYDTVFFMTKMLKQLIYCISISQIIFSENVDNEEQEDRRNLSTDILDYVLQALNYE